MALIVNIDTATETAHVSIAEDGKILHSLINDVQKDHAAFLQPALEQLIKNTGIGFSAIDGVAFTAGPGSYTGLRVGMASAKGLCYALNKPLIAISTLKVMAKAAVEQADDSSVLFCPMIDARRMEVFTAIYNNALTEVLPPCALVLDENSYFNYLQKNKIVFFGSGMQKWRATIQNNHALFTQVINLPAALAALSYEYFQKTEFADLAYAEPFYIKEFISNM